MLVDIVCTIFVKLSKKRNSNYGTALE